jgi:hypothetical protein
MRNEENDGMIVGDGQNPKQLECVESRFRLALKKLVNPIGFQAMTNLTTSNRSHAVPKIQKQTNCPVMM